MTVQFSIKNPVASVSSETQNFLKRKHQLYINGAWVDAVDGRRRDVVDPATGHVISNVADAGSQDVDAAVNAARAAFENGYSFFRGIHVNHRFQA